MGSSDEGCRRLERLELEEAQGHVPRPADRAFVAQHRAACEACRTQAAAAALLRHTDDEGAAVPLDELSRQRFVQFVVTRAAAEGPLLQEREPGARGRRRATWVAAALVLLALGAGLALTLTWTKDRGVGSQGAGKRDGEAARVVLRSGVVRVDGAGAPESARLAAGSTVRVRQGRAALALPDEANVLLGSRSAVRVVQLLSQSTTLYLERGELLASVKPKRHRRLFVVVTRAGRVEVTGTIFSVRVAQEVTVRVLRGSVRVVEPGRPPRSVRRGQTTTLGAGDRAVRTLTAAEERTVLERARTLGLLGRADAASLTVHSRPAGAVVSVDGVAIGRTPLQASLLAGHRLLVVAGAGRAPVQEQLTLRPGDRIARDYELSATVAIAAPPPGKASAPTTVAPPATTPPATTPPATTPAPEESPLMAPVVIRRRAAQPPAGAIQSSPRELLARARKHRAARQWRGAAEAYRELLLRYPRTAAARASRVALGMLLLEHLGQPAAALSLFTVYLSSTRRGVLATEAAYGRIRALRRLGRRTAERSALREFLKYYPGALQAPLVKRRLKALAASGSAGAKR